MLEKIKSLYSGEANPYVRYAMIFVAGGLVMMGLLPPDQAYQFVELTAGAVTLGAAIIWYVYSEARDALKERVAKKKASVE